VTVALLPNTVQVRNIHNAEAFVQAAIGRAWVIQPANQDERDDILSEGLTILLELSARFDEHRPGYERPGSFSLYASKYLPLRLVDAWAKMRREHRYAKDSEGRRVVEFGEAPLSIDANMDQPDDPCVSAHSGTRWLACDDPDPRTPVATGWSPPARVHDAMIQAFGTLTEREIARGVLCTMDEGYTVAETAMLLGMKRRDVDHVRACVASALVGLEGEPRWVKRRDVIASYALQVPEERAA
jgi:hypothetical protein